MRRNVWYFLMILALAVGLGSCNNPKNTEPDEPILPKGTTYMGISIKVPSSKGSRSADDPNYNLTGTYTGYTKIDHLDIYLLTSDGTTLLMNTRFQSTDLVFGSNSSGEDMIRLVTPFQTVPGNKIMVIVINSPNVVHPIVPPNNFLYATTTSNSLNASTLVTQLPLPTPSSPSPSPLSLAYVDYSSSTTEGTDTIYEDVLVLAGQSAVFSITDNISALQVAETGTNLIDISVIRVPSRTVITSTASSTVVNSVGTTIGTISNLTYSVGQGANSVYLFPQLDASGFTQSWGYSFIPGPAVGADYASNAPLYYDYSDLNTLGRVIPPKPASGNMATLPGVFLFETTHPYGTDASSTGFRKGNTPYILVRATFVPDPSQITDGGTLTGGTFYVGSVDGKIYSSIANAQSYTYGSQNQPVYTYTAGKVLYYVWLNPDNIQTPINSPVVRNNIYCVNISSITSFGYNWNPLVPPGTIHNPDPQPSTGVEPTSPISPNDPLGNTNTYMSVEVTVLSWNVHSYEVDL